MDYYQELGVERCATPEEIRRSYKRLARLLHPDRCGDPKTRVLAEIQMKRLNRVLQILTNPAQRASYDRQLVIPAISPGAVRLSLRSIFQRYWAVAAGIVFLVAMCGLARWSPPIQPNVPVQAPPQPSIPAEVSANQKHSHQSHPKRSPLAEPKPSIPEDLTNAMETAWAPSHLETDQPIELTRRSPANYPTAGESSTAPSAASAPGFAGEWLYAPSPRTQHTGLYPPEYIELRIDETSGFLRGRYRARYRVSDQAISPAVSFQFEGLASPEGTRLPWRGGGGSSGEVSLRPLPSGALEVSWVATELGQELGLISGTAVLVRKME